MQKDLCSSAWEKRKIDKYLSEAITVMELGESIGHKQT